jgi:transposase-like protein
MNLLELFKEISDNDKAVASYAAVRWKDGVVCPYCKSDKTCAHYPKHKTKRWQCFDCKKSFSVIVGTIFIILI